MKQHTNTHIYKMSYSVEKSQKERHLIQSGKVFLSTILILYIARFAPFLSLSLILSLTFCHFLLNWIIFVCFAIFRPNIFCIKTLNWHLSSVVCKPKLNEATFHTKCHPCVVFCYWQYFSEKWERKNVVFAVVVVVGVVWQGK